MSCSAIYNEYDGVQHDYTQKQGLVWEHIFLPDFAPAEWQERAKLWNAVEEAEKTKDSRLAREFVAALPIELGKGEWVDLLSQFIQEQFVDDGMCADVAIHDTDGHNTHAHIMLTVRPLNENGTWQHKTEKEYLCVKDGEERGFTAAEYKEAQKDGWEKQYQSKVGKKKEYMTPSAAEAQGVERVSKYPKSTKYGRQNPTSERWNSEEQLVKWRAAWADEVNLFLEQKGLDERIDHRSFADQGKDEQPTIHEGVVARTMEKNGIVSDRCEINRQIRRDNALLRQIKAEIQSLITAVQNTVLVIAQATERLRANMIIMAYQGIHTGDFIKKTRWDLTRTVPIFRRYSTVTAQIKVALFERKTLLAKKNSLAPLHFSAHRRINARVAELAEELEELKSEKERLMASLGKYDEKEMKNVKTWIDNREMELQKSEVEEEKYSAELNNALSDYRDLESKAAELSPDEIEKARISLRPEEERRAESTLKNRYGDSFDPAVMHRAKDKATNLLRKESALVKRPNKAPKQEQGKEPQHRTVKKKKAKEWER